MNTHTITSFSGAYRFLSNFHPSLVYLDSIAFMTVENAYQAAKTENAGSRLSFVSVSPGRAKRLGKNVTLREDWESVKINVMRDLLFQKFSTHPHLRQALLDTHNASLIEGNSWGDRFWGESPIGTGKNILGHMLMDLRTELREGTGTNNV